MGQTDGQQADLELSGGRRVDRVRLPGVLQLAEVLLPLDAYRDLGHRTGEDDEVWKKVGDEEVDQRPGDTAEVVVLLAVAQPEHATDPDAVLELVHVRDRVRPEAVRVSADEKHQDEQDDGAYSLEPAEPHQALRAC